MNAILMPLDASAVGFFGVYYKLQNFLYMPLYGLTNTMAPIIGYNLGAEKPARIRRLTRWALWFALAIMGAGAALFFAFPKTLLGMFGKEALAFAGGAAAIRILAPSFLPAGAARPLPGLCRGLGAAGTHCGSRRCGSLLCCCPQPIFSAGTAQTPCGLPFRLPSLSRCPRRCFFGGAPRAAACHSPFTKNSQMWGLYLGVKRHTIKSNQEVRR